VNLGQALELWYYHCWKHTIPFKVVM